MVFSGVANYVAHRCMSPFTQIPFPLTPRGNSSFQSDGGFGGGGGVEMFYVYFEIFGVEIFNKNFFGCVI